MRNSKRALYGLFLAIPLMGASQPQAQEIWSGNGVSFAKASFADHTLAANQDRLTSQTWITRASSQGIFNIVTEAFHNKPTSPANTRWAYEMPGNGNDGLVISAANHAALTFEGWQDSVNLQPRMAVGLPGVMHMIAEDIYVDIMFTSFEGGSSTGGGGAFAYTRGGPPAAQSIRSGGTNPMSLSSNSPVLGSSLSLNVDLSTTGHSMCVLLLYSSPTFNACPGGQVILVDGMFIANLGLRTGPSANYNFMVPSDPALVGATISAQAGHIMGVIPFALSNAIDLTLGY